MTQKFVTLADVAIGSVFAWHNRPYVKLSESTANPVENDNKVSSYQAQIDPRERVAITEATALITALRSERAELEQAYRAARAPMEGTGSYGQVNMRDVANAENAEMVLRNWDDEHGADLARLVAQYGKHFGAEMLEQHV